MVVGSPNSCRRKVSPVNVFGLLSIFYMSCVIRVAFTRLKMTRGSTIRRLTAKLRIARLRVRRLEMLLVLAEREAVARCEHDWETEYPSGPRDNGERSYRCKKCGTTE